MARVVPMETKEELRVFRDVGALLDRKRNPFWKHGDYKLFAGDGGRIAAVFDANRIAPDRIGYIAFFDPPPSMTVAAALLNAARWWLSERGVRTVRGPVEPSLFGAMGVDAEGPVARQFAAAGWRKAFDRYEYAAEVSSLRAARPNRATRVRVRPIDRRSFELESDTMWWLYHSAWRRNREFAPVARDEFFSRTSEWRRSMVPSLSLIAECGAEPAGFAVTIEDRGQLRLAAFGVREGFRRSGAAMALAAEWVEAARELGAGPCNLGWIGEEHAAAHRWIESIGARRTAVRRVFECEAILR